MKQHAGSIPRPGVRKMKPRIGYIGLGLMGGSLARHLLSAGYALTVHDADAAKVQAIVKAGGNAAGGPGQIAAQGGLIIMSLPDSQVVSQVVNESLRLFETGRKGLVVLDTSTADPAVSAELAAKLRQKGIEMLDSTISGTSTMCAAKESLFMVGGKKEIFEQCEPVFAAMSREWIYMGENGTGAAIKLVVNLVLALTRLALAEGLTLAKKAGLDQLQTLEGLKKSAAFSKAMDQKGYRMVKKQFLPPASRLASSYKDARLILTLGARLDCPFPLISFTVQAMASEVSKGRK